MITLRIQTLAAAVAGAASLFAGTAHAGGYPCASAAECGGSYRPASPAYALTPPGPARANAGYGQQGAYPAGYVGYDQASRGPARAAPGYVGYDRSDAGQAYGAEGYGPAPYARGGDVRGAYAQGAYVRGGYAYGAQGGGYGPGAVYPAGGPECATLCVPAYQVVQVAAPVETVALASDVYTGGVGVTEISGGGGGGFNGNFEVQGFGDASAFASSHAQAQADAVSYARSLSYAKASAEANANAYAKVYASAMANSSAYASANSSTNVNIKLNSGFFGKVQGGYMKGGGYGMKGGKDCNCQPKPQPVACNTCGGGGVGSSGGWGGGKSWGAAPMARRH